MSLCDKQAFAAWLSTVHQRCIMILPPFVRIASICLLQVDSQPKDEKYVEVVLKLLDQADIFSASDLVGVKPERLVTSNVSPGMEGFLTRAIKVYIALYVFSEQMLLQYCIVKLGRLLKRILYVILSARHQVARMMPNLRWSKR